MRFVNDLETNIGVLQRCFLHADTFRVRRVRGADGKARTAVCFSDDTANGERISREIVAPMTRRPPRTLRETGETIACSSRSVCGDVRETAAQIAAGSCAVLTDGTSRVLIYDVKAPKERGVSQPDGEGSVTGAHDGFNENLMQNLSLLKKRLATPRLKTEMFTVGKCSATPVALCYMDGIAKRAAVRDIRRRIRGIAADTVWNTARIAEILCGGRGMLFPRTGATQRPDVVCAKLCEGRIALLVGGCPTAITIPFVFAETFQAPDDYAFTYLYGNVGRLLRWAGFRLAVLLPGVYLALILHHPQMLPEQLAYSIAAAQRGVPFSSLTEMLALLIVFEFLRETGARMPEAIGLALNIVGAIVLGQASVDAGFFSAPMIIIGALSGTLGLMVRQLRGTVFFLRIGFLLAGAWLGLAGIAAGWAATHVYLCSLRSFGAPYFRAATPFSPSFFRGVPESGRRRG